MLHVLIETEEKFWQKVLKNIYATLMIMSTRVTQNLTHIKLMCVDCNRTDADIDILAHTATSVTQQLNLGV